MAYGYYIGLMNKVLTIMNELWLGDCLELMSDIPDDSVDMILCDLPYEQSGLTSKWDKLIPLDKLWQQYKRISKKETAIVLFGAQPFTTKLAFSNLDMFKYEWIWCKNKCTGYFDVQYRPMRKHENILVFGYGGCSNGSNSRMNYSPQDLIELKQPKSRKGKTVDATCRSSVMAHGEQKFTNYPNTLLYFENESKTIHPTQKPLSLCEYLIRTYTNESDLVLDNCMGSGTTCLAARNLNRQFIGIEKDENYFNIARERIFGKSTN